MVCSQKASISHADLFWFEVRYQGWILASRGTLEWLSLMRWETTLLQSIMHWILASPWYSQYNWSAQQTRQVCKASVYQKVGFMSWGPCSRCHFFPPVWNYKSGCMTPPLKGSIMCHVFGVTFLCVNFAHTLCKLRGYWACICSLDFWIVPMLIQHYMWRRYAFQVMTPANVKDTSIYVQAWSALTSHITHVDITPSLKQHCQRLLN